MSKSKLDGWYVEIKQNNVISIQMNLLNRCTSRCKSCRKYTWPDSQISLEDAKRTLKVLKEKFGLQTVVFSGGDPILYDGFAELINYVVYDLGLKYSLITTLITRNANLLRIIAKTAYRIHVSIDSMDAGNYKNIRGVNALQLVKSNVMFVNGLRGDKIHIRISSTMSKMNCEEVIDLFKFAEHADSLINFYLLHTWDNLKMSESEIEEFYEHLSSIRMYELENGKHISNADILLIEKHAEPESHNCTRCYLPMNNCTIDANGDIYPCCKLLDDNGCYGEQVKNAYGNIKGKKEEELVKEFEKRKEVIYPVVGTLCDECAQRYTGLLHELEDIHNGRIQEVERKMEKKPIFF